MKKLAFGASILLVLILLLFGATGVVVAQDVRYDFDKNKDFSKRGFCRVSTQVVVAVGTGRTKSLQLAD